MTIPSQIMTILRELPAQHFEKIPQMVPEIGKLVPKGKSVKTFLIESIQTGDKAAIEAIYNPLSLFLAAGGCFGGPVGTVFNAVDAAFCVILANTLGLIIDLLAIVLVFPGAKAGLTGVVQAVKALPKLIGKSITVPNALKAFNTIVLRAKKSGEFSEEMVVKLYDICKPYMKGSDELLKLIYSKHRKAFDLIEKNLNDFAGKGVGDVGKLTTKEANPLGKGVTDVGRRMTKGQQELKRGYDLSKRGIQPQSQIILYRNNGGLSI